MQKFAHKNATCVFTEIMNEFSSYNCIGVGAIHCLLSWLWLIAQYSSSSRIKAAVLLIFRINEWRRSKRQAFQWMNEWMKPPAATTIQLILFVVWGSGWMNFWQTDPDRTSQMNCTWSKTTISMCVAIRICICSRGHHYVTAQLQRKWLI